MIRSFDYAPARRRAHRRRRRRRRASQIAYRAAEWSARNRAASSGYTEQRGEDLGRPAATLLDAYLADKVVYEAVYEARNRPGWLSIPLAALGGTQ